jgi:hypothetical protein
MDSPRRRRARWLSLLRAHLAPEKLLSVALTAGVGLLWR